MRDDEWRIAKLGAQSFLLRILVVLIENDPGNFSAILYRPLVGSCSPHALATSKPSRDCRPSAPGCQDAPRPEGSDGRGRLRPWTDGFFNTAALLSGLSIIVPAIVVPAAVSASVYPPVYSAPVPENGLRLIDAQHYTTRRDLR